MSLEQNDSVERTLEEILAELELLPEPSAASKPSVSQKVPAPQTEKKPELPKTVTVTVSAETVKPVSVEAEPSVSEQKAVPAADGGAEEVNEPSTMVFSPSRLREQMRAAAAVSDAPRAKASPPSSASLKAELEQLSRSGGGHTVTEQLRAQDPVQSVSMPKKAYLAAKKAAVKKLAPQSEPQAEEPEESAEKTVSWKREAFEWIKALVIAFVAAFIIFFVLIRVVNVEGTSMQPTLEPGDRLVISGLFYTPENGDIVVTSDDNGLGKPLIKRIIALGGQTVDVDEEGRILVNGIILQEDYILSSDTSVGDLTFPLTVPEGSVFLLGDNRAVSVDSRSSVVGMISEDDLEGRVLFRFWPVNRIGAVK